MFDKNVPIGVRRFLPGHDVRTFAEMQWHPQMENGELLAKAETEGFELMVTTDQNIRYQQNLTGRKMALVVLGSNIWPVVRSHRAAIASKAATARPEVTASSKCRCRRNAAATDKSPHYQCRIMKVPGHDS